MQFNTFICRKGYGTVEFILANSPSHCFFVLHSHFDVHNVDPWTTRKL